MKAIHNLIQSVKPHFEEGGKLSRFWVVFDSLETFAFTPGHVTSSGAHVRDSIDLKRTMFLVIVAMIPCLLFGMWNIGYQHHITTGDSQDLIENILVGAKKVIPLIVVSYGVGLGIEFLFAGLRGHSINEGYLVSGMLIPLIMPVDVPLWMVALAVAFAVVVAKEVFGGTGMNILNVALTARAFLFFAYPKQLSGEIWIHEAGTAVDGYTGATALGHLASTVGLTAAETEALYSKGALLGPEGLFDQIFTLKNCFLGLIPGSVGETSALACLIGAAILIWTGIGSWRVIASFLAGGLVMGVLFNLIGANAFMKVNPLHQVVMGGFMFGMVFMATDPVSAAQTNTGKLWYGFFGGLFSIMIRVFNPAYPEGVMMAILFMNVMAPLIDHYVIEANIKRREKRLTVAAA